MTTMVHEALETYRRDGYAIFPAVFSKSELDPFTRVIDRAVDNHARSLLAQGKITDLHEDLGFARRLAAIETVGMRTWNDAAMSPELYDLFTHPPLLDSVEAIIGPEITFNGDYHLRPKTPGSDLVAIPWHQDSQYYGEVTRHMQILTVIVALVDATEENGCLWVIPGSHKWGYLPAYFTQGDRNVRSHEDVEKRGPAIPVPMKAGDAIAFGNLLFHSSKVNRSDHIRWTIDLRYSPNRSAREAEGMSADERAAYDNRFEGLIARHYRPTVVRSRHERVPSYEQWTNLTSAATAR
jgi:phytanoyl-CoA hydroxylase